MKLHRRQFLHLASGAAALPAMSRFARAQTYPSRKATTSRATRATRATTSMTILYARNFSPSQHAGTEADPWPGVAILDALRALPQPGGGTVVVNNGIWVFDKAHTINNVNDFVLQGESHATELRFVGDAYPNGGHLWFGSDRGGVAGFTNGVVENLYINASLFTGGASATAHHAFRFSNGRNSEFRNNKMLGHPNGDIPAMIWEGGENVKIHHNEFIAPNGGDACCQVQHLGGTANSGFEVSDNHFDSSVLYSIGLSNLLITRNLLTNERLKNSIGIMCCGRWTEYCVNVIVDNNTVDARAENGACITGLPNDPGGMSVIKGFKITNNTIKGTSASIHCQSFNEVDYNGDTLVGNEKYDVTITGNKLHSAWTGSRINCTGGVGKVDGVLVTENTLTNDANKPNTITTDAHTYNLQAYNNQGLADMTLRPRRSQNKGTACQSGR